jgi:hypothetical protein
MLAVCVGSLAHPFMLLSEVLCLPCSRHCIACLHVPAAAAVRDPCVCADRDCTQSDVHEPLRQQPRCNRKSQPWKVTPLSQPCPSSCNLPSAHTSATKQLRSTIQRLVVHSGRHLQPRFPKSLACALYYGTKVFSTQIILVLGCVLWLSPSPSRLITSWVEGQSSEWGPSPPGGLLCGPCCWW